MTTVQKILIAGAFLVPASTAGAGDDLPIPADEFVYCTVCHGVQLMGNAITRAPRLSGMAGWYVENQLKAFKNGWRGKHAGDGAGMDMQPMAAALSDEQISEVAAFVSSTRSDIPPRTIDGDIEAGKKLYAACAACHGVSAEGNIALGSPALSGMNDWYLVTQIRNFREGARGGQPGDINGMQMRASAKLLADEQAIRDVVAYITTLQEE